MDTVKSRYEIVFEKARSAYADAIKIIGDMYDNVFSKKQSFTYGRAQIFADFDAYLQAVLVKICHGADRFGEEEMKFVENIADYGKLIDGTNFEFFAGCVSDMSDKLAEKADEKLKEIPICFKMSGALDSGKNVIGVTKTLLDVVVKISFNLKLIDAGADIKNNADIGSALKNLYVFISANGINIK